MKASISEVINYIILLRLRPIDLSQPSEAASRKRTSRSSSLEPTTYYLLDWLVNKSTFRKALATFIKTTYQLDQLLHPIS